MLCKYSTLHWDIIFQIRQNSISAFQHLLPILGISYVKNGRPIYIKDINGSMLKCHEDKI